MHELSIARRIAAIVQEKTVVESARSVKTIWIDIGPFTCLEPDALKHAFAIAARGTRADAAKLAINVLPADGTCPRCGSTQPVDDYFCRCEVCDAVLDIKGGDTLRVARMEVV